MEPRLNTKWLGRGLSQWRNWRSRGGSCLWEHQAQGRKTAWPKI